MRVDSLGMTFCFALRRWEGDMSGISSAFRKAKRTGGLILFVRMVSCLCGEKGQRAVLRPSACLNKQLSQFFGEARFGRDFVALRLDILPPVLVWTFHGPTAQFSDDEYVPSANAFDIPGAFVYPGVLGRHFEYCE